LQRYLIQYELVTLATIFVTATKDSLASQLGKQAFEWKVTGKRFRISLQCGWPGAGELVTVDMEEEI
jgi:hypothetical protein